MTSSVLAEALFFECRMFGLLRRTYVPIIIFCGSGYNNNSSSMKKQRAPPRVCCTPSGPVFADEKERVCVSLLPTGRGRLYPDAQVVKQTISLEPRWPAGLGRRVVV